MAREHPRPEEQTLSSGATALTAYGLCGTLESGRVSVPSHHKPSRAYDDIAEHMGSARADGVRSILARALQGDGFSFGPAYGRSWPHAVAVDKIPPPEPGWHYPVCVKGKRACPLAGVGEISIKRSRSVCCWVDRGDKTGYSSDRGRSHGASHRDFQADL